MRADTEALLVRTLRAAQVIVALVVIAAVIAGMVVWANAEQRKSDRTIHELCTYSTPEGVLDLCK